MIYTAHEQTNPRAHAEAPYALRYAGGRPEGSFATVEQAVSSARGNCSVVTEHGWWIVGRITQEGR